MTKKITHLTNLTSGKEGILFSVEGGWGAKRRLGDMGLKEGVKLKVLHSHRHGPCIVKTGSTRLVLGHGMADKILVEEL